VCAERDDSSIIYASCVSSPHAVTVRVPELRGLVAQIRRERTIFARSARDTHHARTTAEVGAVVEAREAAPLPVRADFVVKHRLVLVRPA